MPNRFDKERNMLAEAESADETIKGMIIENDLMTPDAISTLKSVVEKAGEGNEPTGGEFKDTLVELYGEDRFERMFGRAQVSMQDIDRNKFARMVSLQVLGSPRS